MSGSTPPTLKGSSRGRLGIEPDPGNQSRRLESLFPFLPLSLYLAFLLGRSKPCQRKRRYTFPAACSRHLAALSLSNPRLQCHRWPPPRNLTLPLPSWCLQRALFFGYQTGALVSALPQICWATGRARFLLGCQLPYLGSGLRSSGWSCEQIKWGGV